jgi:hypothetical protein
MPGSASAGFERNAGAKRACWLVRFEQGIMRTAPVKYWAGPLPEGCEPDRLISMGKRMGDGVME